MATSHIVLLVAAIGSALGFVTRVPLASESLPPSETGKDWNDTKANGVQDDVREIYIREAKGNRMARLKWIGNSAEYQLVDCDFFGDNLVIRGILKGIPEDQIRFVEKDKMKVVISDCIKLLAYKKPILPKFPQAPLAAFGRWTGLFSSLLIHPGTKWCGPGDIADDYNDLGPSVGADKCCRAHDHCNDTIRANQVKHGLRNKSLHTKSHCNCDHDFYKCLSKARTTTAKSVGQWYFNLFKVQCFKKDYPIISCLKRTGTNGSCQKYLQDKKSPKKWQFFDAKYFKTSATNDY